jgi:hypothetical protein
VAHSFVVDEYARHYDWFTEGFQARNLKDAKALLQEVAL